MAYQKVIQCGVRYFTVLMRPDAPHQQDGDSRTLIGGGITMRITNRMMTTQYTVLLTSFVELNLNTQVASGRKFAKSSENTSAIKAFQIRRTCSKPRWIPGKCYAKAFY